MNHYFLRVSGREPSLQIGTSEQECGNIMVLTIEHFPYFTWLTDVFKLSIYAKDISESFLLVYIGMWWASI